MPNPQHVTRYARGLYTFPNTRHNVPEGALQVADNVVIDAEYKLEKRRGFNRYGDELDNPAIQLLDYRDRLIVHAGTKLLYDSDGAGTWVEWTGTFNQPQSDTKIQAVEDRGRLIFTTEDGVYSTDSLTNSPKRAGLPSALDTTATLTGTGSGFMQPDTQVGYRVQYSRQDETENKQLIVGGVSRQETIANPGPVAVVLAAAASTVTVTHTAHGYTTGDTILISNVSDALYEEGPHVITVSDANTYTYTVSGSPPANGTAEAAKAQDVSIEHTLSDELIEGDVVELYRTTQSATDDTFPGDRHFLVSSRTLTAGDIATGYITLVDTTPDVSLGLDLETNDTQDTIAGDPVRAAWATSIARFNGHVFYGNTQREHVIQIKLNQVSGITTGTDSITISDGVTTLEYTFETANDPSLKEFELETGLSTTARNIQQTAQNLEKVINRDGNGLITASYDSGVNDDPGIITIRSISVNGAVLSVTSNKGSVWSYKASEDKVFTDTIPASGTTARSTNTRFVNRVYYSKQNRGENVPVLNFLRIGSELSPILGIVNLRDYLLVFKEEGVWRITGAGGPAPVWNVQALHSDVRAVAPNTIVALNNRGWCLADIGVCDVNESSVQLPSRPVEDDIRRIVESFSNFDEISFAIPYENDKKFILATQQVSGDTTAKQMWVYDYITKCWVKWIKDISCGRVLFDDKTLYLGHAVDNYVLKERKNFRLTNDDFEDETIAATITAVDTEINSDGETVTNVDVTWTYSTAITPGVLIEQGAAIAKVVSVIQNGTTFCCTLDAELPTMTTGSADVTLPIASEVRWVPEDVGNSAVLKQFTKIVFTMQRDTVSIIDFGFDSDYLRTTEYTALIRLDLSGYGYGTYGEPGYGESGFVASTPLQIPVPRTFSKTTALSLTMRHSVARENFELEQVTYIYRAASDRLSRMNR